MTIFLLGLAIFFGTHCFALFARGPRAALIDKIGKGPYTGAYALLSLGGFILFVVGWRGADPTPLYVTPYFMRHVVYVLMLIAMILLVASQAPAGKIAAAAKHPMLASVKIWAFAHLLVNGEIRSVILFGGFLAFAVAARIALLRRGAPTPAPGPWRNDVIAIVVGTAIYAAILVYLHRYLGGVPLM